MRAVRIHHTGGPEVLRVDDVDAPHPGPRQAVVAVAAAGLNFIDTYHRGGNYPLELPTTLGLEGAGTVVTVGEDVTEVSAGDRVAWANQRGSYAEQVVVDAWKLVPVPDAVALEVAAAVMLQGLTAHYLVSSTFPLGAGHTALVLAAAGGVGHLLTQLAVRRGARVIATASTEEKAALARRNGAEVVIPYRDVDLADEARRLTDGVGVDVVYDGVGRDTFDRSLDAVRRRGTLVLYGAASGPVAPVDPQVLNRKGSLFLTRPGLADHITDRAELTWRAGELLGAVAAGDLEVRIDRTWPLDEVADAHRYLEAGRTTGKVLLLP